MIIPEETDMAQIESATKRFRSVSLARDHLTVTASVGAAVYPDDAGDAEALIKLSDTLMYQQKRARSAPNPPGDAMGQNGGWSAAGS